MFNLSFEPILSQSIILPETRSPDPGLENVYLELNEQIEKINKELESRENALNTKEAELASLNHFLQEKMNEYKSIEESLLESKFHLEEFQLNTITEIEENSKIIVSLITKLNQLKHELEALVEKVLKQLNCIKKYSLNLEVIQEDPFESTPEVSPNFEFRFGFTEFEEFHKRLKEVERISESFSERMNSTGTVESELETSLDEKIRELSGLYVNKD
jgi:chromosome segregation ATPase